MKSLYFTRKAFSIIIYISLMIALVGCTSFYKVEKVPDLTADDVNNMIIADRYLIIHQNFHAWKLVDAKVQNDFIIGQIMQLPSDQWNYMKTRDKGYTRYKHKNKEVLNQIHFYLNDSVIAEIDSSMVKFPISSIQYTDTYVHAPGMTTISWITPVIITAAIIGAMYFYALSNLGSLF